MGFAGMSVRRTVCVLMVLGAGALAGCTAAFLQYLTAPLADLNNTITIVNETPYRASFSFGAYDDLNRNPPGPVDFQQRRLEAGESFTTQMICAHDTAIGTAKLIRRAIENEIPDGEDFDVDAFDETVHFSDAPADSPLAAIATVGTAEGVTKRVANHYSCGDELIFTFREDPDAPGGFRIDFQLVHAPNEVP